jgi:hypothetical protein
MIAKTVSISTDGSQWDRDALDSYVKRLEAKLPKRPDSPGRRVAVGVELRNEVWAAVVALARDCHPGWDQFKNPPENIHPMSICGRVIDDGSCLPVQRIWNWFSCERDGWLYQQPFFALNPDKFKPDPETK